MNKLKKRVFDLGLEALESRLTEAKDTVAQEKERTQFWIQKANSEGGRLGHALQTIAEVERIITNAALDAGAPEPTRSKQTVDRCKLAESVLLKVATVLDEFYQG